jgi:hypothetical protein
MTNFSTFEPRRLDINAWMQSQPDVTFVDMDATGYDPTTMTADGIHPGKLGSSYFGDAVGLALASLAVPDSVLYTNASDYGQLLGVAPGADLSGTTGTHSGPAHGLVPTTFHRLVWVTGVAG